MKELDPELLDVIGPVEEPVDFLEQCRRAEELRARGEAVLRRAMPAQTDPLSKVLEDLELEGLGIVLPGTPVETLEKSGASGPTNAEIGRRLAAAARESESSQELQRFLGAWASNDEQAMRAVARELVAN